MRYLLRYGFSLLAALNLPLSQTNLVLASDQDPQVQQPLLQDEADSPYIEESVPNHPDGDISTDQSSVNRPHRIAIVGAGPAGSSAAYYLSRFAADLNFDIPLNITVLEANGRIGGRTTTVNALEDPRYPVELGGSIFVEINQILFNATRDFELPVNDRIYESTGADYDLGIWDGEVFVFKSAATDDDEGSTGWKGTLVGWWDIAKLLWRYGMSPLRLRTLQKDVIGRFLRMYDAKFPFADLTRVADEVDLLKVTGRSGSKLLEGAGISEKFAREIVQASSRVNYAQNLPDLHGLETMVCMSTEGAMSIEGGNWQIFDGMLKRSGATLRLNTTVTTVETTKDGTSHVTLEQSNTDESRSTTTEKFDTVLLAHPYKPSTLNLLPNPHQPRDTPDYVTLHVTLFTTPYRPSPLHFGLPVDAQSSVPDTDLTTLPSELDPSFLGRGTQGVGPTKFWSLSTLRVLNPSTDSFDTIPPYITNGHIPVHSLSLNETQYLYKIFSPAPLSAGYMVELFGWDNHPSLVNTSIITDGETEEKADPLSALPKELLTWSHEKTWQSYPYYPPRTSFETFDVYDANEAGVRRRVWSTAPMEMFISTMETSALSGMNVARLIVDRLRGVEEEYELPQGEF